MSELRPFLSLKNTAASGITLAYADTQEQTNKYVCPVGFEWSTVCAFSNGNTIDRLFS